MAPNAKVDWIPTQWQSLDTIANDSGRAQRDRGSCRWMLTTAVKVHGLADEGGVGNVGRSGRVRVVGVAYTDNSPKTKLFLIYTPSAQAPTGRLAITLTRDLMMMMMLNDDASAHFWCHGGPDTHWERDGYGQGGYGAKR